MLILCTSKYVRLASSVHNSTHCILEYVHNAFYLVHKSTKMHSGVVSSEQSPGKTICKCKLTPTENVLADMRKACCVLQ